MPPLHARTVPDHAAAPATSDTPVREWYEAHGAAIYSYLRFHLPSADLAEDFTAEVFLRALRAADRYDPARGGPRPWLFRIAQNLLRDERRQLGRRRDVSLGAFRDLVCDAPSPEERLLWEEEVRGLLAAVGRLAPADRELIGMRYGSGLAAADMAQVLGVGEAVVRTRLWRALRRLRALLEA